MRITIERDARDMLKVTVFTGLYGEGEAKLTFWPETVPVVDIKEGVQGEVFLPGDVEIYSAKDHDKISPRPLLSVWRGKMPGNGR